MNTDLEKTFLTKDAEFTDIEEYPILKEEFISKAVPYKIIPFDKSLKVKNRKDYYVCFYCNDDSFKNIYNYPYKYLNYLKTFAGVITPDFSPYGDIKIIKQKTNINKNLELGYFYGNNNIKIIPNIRYGVQETMEEFYKAIPKGTLVSIGTYGFIKTLYEQNNYIDFLERLIDNLHPSGIIVYGSMPERVFKRFKKYGINFYQYNAYITDKLGGNNEKK